MPSISEMAPNVFILDNGSCSIKAGFATDSEPKLIPHCITKAKNERRRQFIGSQLNECKDFSGLYYMYPFHRGFVINWEIEKPIWDHTFGDLFNVDFKETCIIMTEPYFNFMAMRESMTEILFEDYNFHSVLRINAGTLSAYKDQKTYPSEMCCLLIDSGFSFTHIVPYIKGKKLKSSIRRIDCGGKILTNHLKEITSYRQLNVLDETYVLNQVKEDVCYVSTDFLADMEIAKKKGKENTIIRDYVLPDYTVIRRGYVRPPEETTGRPKENEQLIRMNNERFMVPEVLFHPSDVGLSEMGISETIMNSIESTHEEVQPHLYKNILCTGGNACFPGFRERVEKDIRSEASCLYDVKVKRADNPLTNAWEGGALLSNDPEFAKLIVTRKQYEEHGYAFCADKFDV